MEILSNLYSAKLKAYRLQQLLSNKEKTSEEVLEQNALVDELEWARDMKKEPEYIGLIEEFVKACSCSEDIDFITGTFYGISAQGIFKKEIDDERKEKMLKLCAQMWLDLRNETIKQLEKNQRSSMEQPKPSKLLK